MLRIHHVDYTSQVLLWRRHTGSQTLSDIIFYARLQVQKRMLPIRGSRVFKWQAWIIKGSEENLRLPRETILGRLIFQIGYFKESNMIHFQLSVDLQIMWASLTQKLHRQPTNRGVSPLLDTALLRCPDSGIAGLRWKMCTAQKRAQKYQKGQKPQYLPWLILGSPMLLHCAHCMIIFADYTNKSHASFGIDVSSAL